MSLGIFNVYLDEHEKVVKSQDGWYSVSALNTAGELMTTASIVVLYILVGSTLLTILIVAVKGVITVISNYTE
jgi:hypothetical protein